MRNQLPSKLAAARQRLRKWCSRFSATGVVFAVIAWCISLAPSLIPRNWLFQALLTGLCIAIAYGLGSASGGFIRWLGFRTPWPARVTGILWRVFAPIAVFCIVGSAYFGAHFQADLRELFGMERNAPYKFFAQALVACAIALILLFLARVLRSIGRWVANKLQRWFPYRAAVLAATVIVGLVFVLLVDGTLVRGTLSQLNTLYATSDKEIPKNLLAPTEPERSGSIYSFEDWDSLGYQGRAFVGSGPTRDDLQAFADSSDVLKGRAAKTPIRVYAGLNEDRNLDETARRVVAELDRTNAWDREVLVVATSTGTGWIDPAFTSSLEYLFAGDTAVASMQYSYLPSGVAFVTDRATPPLAGKALFEAVYEAWNAKPENERPRLQVFGLSLGSYGMQGAFSGLQDITERADGALFVGTPSFTPMWKNFTQNRDPGSPHVAPVIQEGRQVRFSSSSNSAADVWDVADFWRNPRIVYVQHASDAVTWWNPDLIWNSPDWISETPAPDRPQSMKWYPVVTFLQLTFDMFVAGDVPSGHGHMYEREYADAIAAVTNQDQWDTAQLELIKEWVQFGPNPHSSQEQGR